MSVLRTLLGVVRSVLTLLAPMPVVAMMVIALTTTAIVAMVRENHDCPDIQPQTYAPTDVDECAEGLHKCDQNCHNNIGSHGCSCDPGYRLHTNGFGCYG